MTTADYIDWDEGRDFEVPVVELPACESCGHAADCLTYLPDWNLFACADCVHSAEEQECTCQRIDVDLYDAHNCAAHNRRAA